MSPLVMFAQETDPIKVQKIDTTKLDFVPFAIIEQAPIYPGCEKLDKPLQKMCLQNQIKWHVAKKFNTGMANKLGLDAGKKRVYVQFTIDKEGFVTGVRARGPHKALEKEGIRVVKLLPQMTPGEQKGESVDVKYTLPITLIVDKPKRKYKF